MTYTVYILKSETTGRFYTGYTRNLENRLKKHNAGATKSTKNSGPWVVVHAEQFDNKQNALERERELKKLKSRGIYDKLR